MGILDLMLGKSGEGQQGVEGRSYKLPEETHEFVYPTAVRREELEAVDDLLAADAEAPSIEENAGEIQDAFDDLFDGDGPDATKLVERERETRQRAETLLETWHERLDEGTDAMGVVYIQSDDYSALAAFVKRCTERGERDDDPFELPDSFPAVPPLLKRLDESTDSRYRAVVHTDLLPSQ
ncbi:hypothetical protein CV102_01700 [Natronococcus pandeyae]|uniref:Uncharacterized protein n=1 Tax=Natronococcus pandeyae TaxID=2055836 RepID=A0A8J8Q7V9_9EURY|nr:hypothetical protein [Natronococcus pandeyae]TYL40318.1 hypothetical protein CV102_01700 [Natronococcus pandeyae]